MVKTYALKEDDDSVAATGLAFIAPLITVIILAVSVFVGFFHILPPAEVPASAPASEFSAGRAAENLREIAQKPHPVGSLEHKKVRDYILGQLSALGLSPQVQKSSAFKQTANGQLSGATVENVSASIEGNATNKSVLLVAHYDSVPTSPGASDNGSGVATLLETARALKASPPLKNEVIFLFTDAEEIGLLGAKSFVDEDSNFKDVEVALNFDARGNGGPSLMFETSSGNGWLIDEFAQAAPYPVANSLTSEVYKRLPNDSDLSVFKRAGIAGLNFAYFEGLAHYHSTIDDLSNIDLRSLQHQGSYALAMVRHFGGMSLDKTSAGDQIYFSTVGSVVMRYSKTFALILAAGEVLLFLLVAGFALSSGLISIRGILLGLAAFAVSLAVCSGVVALVWRLMKSIHGQFRAMPNGAPYNGDLYFVGFVILTFATLTALYILFSKRLSAQNLRMGVLLGWLILTVLVTLLIPGASYLLAWPLLFGLVSAAISLRAGEKTDMSAAQAVVMSALAVPGIILFVPVIYLLFVSMGLNLSWAVAALEVLLLGLLFPHISLLGRWRRWLLPVAAATLALGFIVAANIGSGFDRAHPQVNSVFYALNADSGKAAWASYDRQPDEWTSKFLGPNPTRGSLSEYFPTTSPGFLRSEAPAFPLQPPSVILQRETTQNGVRTLQLRLVSLRQASILSATFEPISGLVTQVNGKPVNASLDAGWGIRYYGAGDESVDLTVELNSSAPIKINLLDMTYQLPQTQEANYQQRPDYMIPAQLPLSDSTLVSKSFSF